MEKRKSVKEFESNLEKVADYREKELIKRSEWGEINFEDHSFTFERLWNTIDHLKVLPVEYLSDSILTGSSSKLLELEKHLKNVDQFKIAGTSNPEQERNNLANTLRTKVDEFNSQIAIWIPFLAYQKGDVSKNISKLQEAIANAETELDKSIEKANNKIEEIETVSQQAKEAAATAGAAVFTQEFFNEAEEQLEEAKNWLWATIVLASVTALIALSVLIITYTGHEVSNVWQFVSAKITLFILLFTATIWSGKIYRSLKHQAAINKHRSLGLKTFQAFSHAASDDQTKNAVLLETTRSIFSISPTGLVDSKQHGSDSDIRIIELLNSVARSDGN